MKATILITLAALILMTGCGVIEKKQEESFDVRKTTWGMTKEEVRKSEEKTPLQIREDALKYEVTEFGVLLTVEYKFSENRLASALYVVNQDYSELKLFRKIRALLTAKYGLPGKDVKEWIPEKLSGIDTKEEMEEYWGSRSLDKAVGLGLLEFYAVWRTENTKIELMLKELWNPHKIVSIEYTPRRTAE